MNPNGPLPARRGPLVAGGRSRRRVAVIGVAALALIAATGSTATADPTPPPSYVKSWLALSTDASGGSVSLVNGDKTLARTQTLASGKACSLTQGDGSLAVLSSSPTSPGVGFSTGSIGVREKGTSSGTSCAAVDFAKLETLTLSLGSGVGGLVAMSASLDIDLKQNARILATATLSTDPTAAPAYFELQSGANIGATPLKPTATVFTCNNPADSGPDSGANNNCRWEISAPSWTRTKASGAPGIAEDSVVFDTLTLEAGAGAFSLMGGADGPVVDPEYPLPSYLGTDADPSTNDVSIASASIFELVDGVVACGETVTLSGSAVDSSWNRLANFGSGPEVPCLPFPYSSRTGLDADGMPFAEFTKPLDFETRAQALWTSTFVVGGGSTIPPIVVELDVFNSPETILFDPLPACDSTYFTGTVFTGPPEEPAAPTACLVSGVRGTGKLSKSVTYTAYIYGDASMRR